MKPLDPKKAYWFVLGTTTVNREMKIYDAMQLRHIECYVPLKYEVKRVRDRQQETLVPAIAGLIFARGTEEELKDYMLTSKDRLFFRNSAYSNHQDRLIVSDREMRVFMAFVEENQQVVNFFSPEEMTWREGEMVRVTIGSKLYEGRIVRIKGKRKKMFALEVKGLAFATIALTPDLVQAVETEEQNKRQSNRLTEKIKDRITEKRHNNRITEKTKDRITEKTKDRITEKRHNNRLTEEDDRQNNRLKRQSNRITEEDDRQNNGLKRQTNRITDNYRQRNREDDRDDYRSKDVEGDKRLLFEKAFRLLFVLTDQQVNRIREVQVTRMELERVMKRLKRYKGYTAATEGELALGMFMGAMVTKEQVEEATDRLRKAIERLKESSMLKFRMRFYLAKLTDDQEEMDRITERIRGWKAQGVQTKQREFLEEVQGLLRQNNS